MAFFFYVLALLFVMTPLSISAGNRVKKGLPLNAAQRHFFINHDLFQAALGKHYPVFW